MKIVWSADELLEHWSVGSDERAKIPDTAGESGRLGFAAQLTFYRMYARFPERRADFAPTVLAHLAEQFGISESCIANYDWRGSIGCRHRRAILKLLRVSAFDAAAKAAFRTWLLQELFPTEPNAAESEDRIDRWFAQAKRERPGGYRLDRIIGAARQSYDERVFQTVMERLDQEMRRSLDALLEDSGEGSTLLSLRADPGRVGLESVLEEAEKLECLRALALPAEILRSFSPASIKRYRRRAATENPWELRRHPEAIRLPLLVFYCVPREAEIIDGLIELLIQITHRITVRAERRVTAEILSDFQHVRGKAGILFRIAAAALKEPDGAVRDVIFPVADEQTFENLLKEQRAGETYQQRIHTVIRSSYASHYRRMLPKLLDILDFRSNNAVYRPLLDAIDVVKRENENAQQHFPLSAVTVEGVIRPKWRFLVIEDAPDGGQRVNRINYEICVLQSLRERLRSKEIWVAGADRYRNPDNDLPADFQERRVACYERLELPLNAEAFIAKMQAEMSVALDQLDRGLARNPDVRLDPRRKKNPIILSPLEPQPEPPNLAAVKGELVRRWGITGLLDIVKETDLRIGFTEAFTTAASREAIDRREIQRRLLLCLYGLGTNTGLKRMSVGHHGISYPELLYTRRRYLNEESMRDAIRRIVNATFEVRRTNIWGEATSACASDSKKFGAWDQNLMTEWHIRYGGRGVMIYWHVERKSVCIYSQLKRCSSSEVASMIEGVLRHDTEMEVDRQYVDSHGQSEVAFGFCRLLSFSLLPRLKGIASQKLSLPTPAARALYPNLAPILRGPIDWDYAATQYDEMIRYTTALREGTAEPEAILRRFQHGGPQHPTYRALAEIGKAEKTIFLCRYLDSEPLRREIHEGLNVVENWNSANSFIFFGKGGEVATNRLEDQKLSVLALHLLQACLVYMNTLMLQRVLEEPAWMARMTEADMRGLHPLPYAHVTPYGRFDLDLEQRIHLGVWAT
jgi:TnpA family transposase